MKKAIALILTLALALALAGCGQSAAPEQNGEKAPAGGENGQAEEAVTGSRLAAFAEKYLADKDYVMTFRIDDEEATYAYKGEMMYMSTEFEDEPAIILRNEDGFYLLSPTEKSGLRLGGPDEDSDEIEDISEAMNAEGDYTTGETEVDGKRYYYEEYAEEDGTARYCFDGEMLRYILMTEDGEEEVMEIVSVEKGAPDSLFAVPADYEVVDLSDLDWDLEED